MKIPNLERCFKIRKSEIGIGGGVDEVSDEGAKGRRAQSADEAHGDSQSPLCDEPDETRVIEDAQALKHGELPHP